MPTDFQAWGLLKDVKNYGLLKFLNLLVHDSSMTNEPLALFICYIDLIKHSHSVLG